MFLWFRHPLALTSDKIVFELTVSFSKSRSVSSITKLPALPCVLRIDRNAPSVAQFPIVRSRLAKSNSLLPDGPLPCEVFEGPPTRNQ